MRFELSDKREAIREIQKFLYFISDGVNNEIPRVAIDGIYEENTENAIRKFQVIYGIEETGIVDPKTYDTLNREYNNLMLSRGWDELIITDVGFPLSVGSQSNDVLLLHLLLIELEKTYTEIGSVRKSTYFSSETERAVMNLQKIFRMQETGTVDAEFYDRIKLELDFIQRINEVYT